MAKDIFKEPLHPIEGIQDFSISESRDRIKRLSKSSRKDFCVVKEQRPSFQDPKDWKPVWSVQRRDKMKILKRKCLN